VQAIRMNATADDDDLGMVPSIGPAEVAVIIVGCTLPICALTLTGLKVSKENLQRIRDAGLRSPVWEPVLFMNLVSPAVAACVSAVMQLKAEWAMGLVLANVTPPTVSASVMALVVGADVTLTLSASMVVLFCSLLSIPVCFAGYMSLYVALGGAGDGAQGVTVALPVAQICSAMAMLLCAAAGGALLNERLAEEEIEVLQKRIKCYIKVAVCCIMLYPLSHLQLMATMTSSFFHATVYTGEDAGTFWLACVVVNAISLLLVLAMVNAGGHDSFTRDAVIVTIVRRNPGISIGIALLSFSNIEGVDFFSAFGIVSLFFNFSMFIPSLFRQMLEF